MKIETTIILLLIGVAFIATTFLLQRVESAPPIPLMQQREKPIPQNLPWYPMLIFGDNRNSNVYSAYPPPIFYYFVGEMDALNLLATIGLGDHVGYGYESQYAVFYEIMNSTRLENLWFLLGNHELVYNPTLCRNYWRQYIGPEYSIIDAIPGWRLVLLDTESDIYSWNNQLDQAVADLNGRKIILLMHRPVYPLVNHNIQADKNASIHQWASIHGWPPLVIQAHWHGWAYYRFNETDWIISGGAGAPLYSASNCQEGAVCVSKYQYMWLILYPNQTYEFAPVMIENGAIEVSIFNATAYIVVNSKLDVYGNPVELPIRIRYTVGGVDVYIVARLPPNSTIMFNINPTDNYRVETNATDFYVYFTTGDPYNATVLYPSDNLALAHYGIEGEISLYEPISLTSPTPTTTTTTTTTKTTTSATSQTTTTTSATATFTTTTTSIETTSPTTTTTVTTTFNSETTTTSITTLTTTTSTTSEPTTYTPTQTTIEYHTPPSKVNEGLKTELLLIMGLVIVGIGVGVLAILKKH
ncbi:MAG: metallophosphoesterase [Thermosphaera sp.]